MNSQYDWSPYMANSQRRIKRAWAPPKWDDLKQSFSVIVFRLHNDGTVTDLRVVDSSGLANFDESALTAVRHAAPFRTCPEGVEESLELQLKRV